MAIYVDALKQCSSNSLTLYHAVLGSLSLSYLNQCPAWPWIFQYKYSVFLLGDSGDDDDDDNNDDSVSSKLKAGGSAPRHLITIW